MPKWTQLETATDVHARRTTHYYGGAPVLQTARSYESILANVGLKVGLHLNKTMVLCGVSVFPRCLSTTMRQCAYTGVA